ncbi:UNVERIFIED_CONTAM: hypothetical protein K2H54_056958 [Gekko kuhli]
MAIERRPEEGGEGRQAPEENGSLPPGEAVPAAAATAAPPAGGLAAEIQSLPPPPPPPAGSCSPLLLDYDGSVLPLLGGLGGGHQRTLVLLTWIPALFIGFSQFSDSFLLDQPTYWCKGTDGRGNWTGPPHLPARGLPAAHNYSRGMLAAPELPTPEAKNTSQCQCSERHYLITAGLEQNVVSKVCGVPVEVSVRECARLLSVCFRCGAAKVI